MTEDEEPYVSPTQRPCCLTLWEDPHKLGCRERYMERQEARDRDDWPRATRMMRDTGSEVRG